MNPQQRTPSTPPPSPQTHISMKELYKRVNQSLQAWGRHHHACYEVFQPVVEMRLKVVEAHAEELVADSKYDPSDVDRQQAVWSLLRKGIARLEPSFLHFDRSVVVALQQLHQTSEWPKKVAIPPECRGYVALSLIYVCKTKTSTQVAALFDVPMKTFYNIRRRAIREIVHRLLAWERHGSRRHSAAV